MIRLYMLDTNTVSYIVRGRSIRARQRLIESKSEEEICISAITEAELLFRLEKRPEAIQLRRMIAGMLSGLRVLPWDSAVAAEYASIRARNERIGINIGNLDLLIAAHAVAAGALLVTSEKAFSRLHASLVIEDWADDVNG